MYVRAQSNYMAQQYDLCIADLQPALDKQVAPCGHGGKSNLTCVQPDNVVLLVLLGSCFYKQRSLKNAMATFKRGEGLLRRALR